MITRRGSEVDGVGLLPDKILKKSICGHWCGNLNERWSMYRRRGEVAWGLLEALLEKRLTTSARRQRKPAEFFLRCDRRAIGEKLSWSGKRSRRCVLDYWPVWQGCWSSVQAWVEDSWSMENTTYSWRDCLSFKAESLFYFFTDFNITYFHIYKFS